MSMLRSELATSSVFWAVSTIAFYLLSKELDRGRSRWWSSPLLVAPVLLIFAALALHATYRDYLRGTHWLVGMLAPATVSFAIPIYEQRAMIRRQWPLLAVGVLVGSATSMLSSWGLSRAFHLDDAITLSLIPRSLSTPFAMIVSGDIGGVPSLTAVFVVITGVVGAAIGEGILACLPLRSSLARGALFGMGAHGAGTAKAHQVDPEMGAAAGLVMVMVGLCNVLAAPLLARLLR